MNFLKTPRLISLNQSIIAIILFLFASSIFAGITHEQNGTVIGAVAGGVLGNQFGKGKGKTAATIVGTLAGGFTGNQVGKSTDEKNKKRKLADQKRRQAYVQQRNAQHYERRYHAKKTQKHHHSKKYVSQKYTKCRPYKSIIWIDDEPFKTTGKACIVKGKWQIIS